ncbi:MAG: PilZ domain-containing protein [Gallionella sp.]
MGRFDRYPVNIQIQVKTHGQLKHANRDTLNLSTGGLAFRCDRKLKPGDVVEISIPFLSPPFETEARVAWCAALKGHHDIGVEFLDQDDAYTARIVEQVRNIESYKNEIQRTEGRILTLEDAAAEWIKMSAAMVSGSKRSR